MAKAKQNDQKPKKEWLECTECGYERNFTHYATKEVTTKDGKVVTAKWPVYEPCPNTGDPEKHPHYHKTRGIFEPVQAQVRVTISGREGQIGRLYQIPKDGDDVSKHLDEILRSFEERQGKRAVKVMFPENDYARRQAEVKSRAWGVEFCQMKSLTPGYGYLFVA